MHVSLGAGESEREPVAVPSILVVEDESLVALDICKQLRTFGYPDVYSARTLEKALDLAQTKNPDLALLDINLNGPVDGIEVAYRLKDCGDIGVVFLTAYADEVTLDRAKQVEPDGYLVKPVTESGLRSTVEVVLHTRKIQKERAEAEANARDLERQLLQAQKMDAIGKLTAGIAHELNNALLAVMGNINLAKTDEPLSTNLEKRLDLALQGSERCATLVRQLLGFSRQGACQPETVELHEVIREILGFLEQVVEKSMRIVFLKGEEDYLVTVDREQLHQTIANLVINAQQAMPFGGRLEFSFDRVEVDGPEVFNRDAKPGSYIRLNIRDDGEGIGEENISRVFEPFFSTKPKGQGTGLGLSVVYGIMQRHGGWIEVKSERYRGATFALYFPETESNVTESGHKRCSVYLPRRRGTVLVVDDEQMIVELLTKCLEDHGHPVAGFTDPEKALNWYKRHAPQVDVIIVDVKMPLLSGVTCFDRIREINDGASVVFFSGHVQDERILQALARGAKGFFQKPADLERLIARIEELSQRQELIVAV